VLINTHGNMKVVREEIFGPVVVAAPFSDLDEIAAQANDSEYGLGAGIWTKDISKAHALAKKLRAGTVWINCYNVFDAALPFGGVQAVRLGPRDGPRGSRGLHRGQGGHHPTLTRYGAAPAPGSRTAGRLTDGCLVAR
jgi:acyl-CoA reductase-like NAD-dependent aldehyde dehydrogenase